jgi:hypothetical protein
MNSTEQFLRWMENIAAAAITSAFEGWSMKARLWKLQALTLRAVRLLQHSARWH